jgi:hypothetical protein
MRVTLLLISSFLLLASCGGGDESVNQEPIIIAKATPEETVRFWIEYRLQEFEGPHFTDTDIYDLQHQDEILRTLEIAEVDTLQDRAAVFVRWSVGNKIFREGYMLRQVDTLWAITHDRMRYFPAHDESWKDDPTALFDKRLHDWEEESASRFEVRNWSDSRD